MNKLKKWLEKVFVLRYEHSDKFEYFQKKYPVGSKVKYFGVVIATVTDVEDEECDGLIHVEITYFDKNLVKRVERVYPHHEQFLKTLNDKV